MITIFCSKYATGNNDGSSINDAFTTLDAAINYNNSSVDGVEIMLDNGEYTISAVTLTKPMSIIGGNLFNSSNYSIPVIECNGITLSTVNINIDKCEITSTNIFINANTSSLITITNSILYDCVIVSAANIIITNTDVININNTANALTVSNAKLELNNVNIKSVGIAIHATSEIIKIINSVFNTDDVGIKLDDCLLNIESSIINKNIGIQSINDSDIEINKTTIDCITAIDSDNTDETSLYINNSIIHGTIISPTTIIDSKNTAYFPIDNRIDYSINIDLYEKIKFTDTSRNIYDPMFGIGILSKPFKLTKDDGTFIISPHGSTIANSESSLDKITYTINDVFIISDYKKELEVSRLMNKIGDELNIQFEYTKVHILHNQITHSAFPYNGNESETWPYEWDIRTFDNYSTVEETYAIPKSIIDITDILKDVFFLQPGVTSLRNMNVTATKKDTVNGVAFDYGNSTNTQKVIWSLNADNVLFKTNIYTNVDLESYNLLSKQKNDDQLFIKLKGLIPFGKHKNGYQYSLESDQDIVVLGQDDLFNFKWLPTDLTNGYALSGLVVYKDNLYILGKQNKKTVILVYPNNDTFDAYTTLEPTVIDLEYDDITPGDITVLEDGSFLISDLNSSKLYNFIPQYDYARVQLSYTNNSKIILREQYDDIKLTL